MIDVVSPTVCVSGDQALVHFFRVVKGTCLQFCEGSLLACLMR